MNIYKNIIIYLVIILSALISFHCSKNHEVKNKATDKSSQTKSKTEYLKAGDNKFKSKDFKGAIQEYNQAIEIDKDYAEGFNNRGLAKDNL